MFIAAQFTIAECWKQPKCPSVNEWIKKLWYIYVMEYYTAEIKKEFLPFAIACMYLESSLLSEIGQEVLGTALPGFRSCKPPCLKLSERP